MHENVGAQNKQCFFFFRSNLRFSFHLLYASFYRNTSTRNLLQKYRFLSIITTAYSRHFFAYVMAINDTNKVSWPTDKRQDPDKSLSHKVVHGTSRRGPKSNSPLILVLETTYIDLKSNNHTIATI